jgi:acetylornithine aminotransferase
LSAGLEVLAKQYPTLLGSVRGWGLLKGVEVVDDAILPGVLVQAAMDNGLLLVAAGKNVVRFVPPLIITEAEIDLALKLFGQAAAQISKTQVKHTA